MKVNLRAKIALMGTVLMSFSAVMPAFAAEVLIYSNEVEEVNANDLILDFDDTGGDVTIQFGDTLAETLLWSDANSRFELSDDLFVDGVDYAADAEGATYVNVNQSITESIDALDDALSTVADGGDQDYSEENFVNDGEDFTTSIDALDVELQDIYDEVGDRTYASENEVTSGETVTASVDALDVAIGDRDYTNGNFLLNVDTDTIAQSLEKLNVGIGDRQYAEENVVTSGQIITASIDAIDVELGDLNDDITALQADGGDQDYSEENFVNDGEDFTTSIDALDVELQDIYDEVGDRTYASENEVTSGETVTASVDALDVAIGDRDYTNVNHLLSLDTDTIAQSLEKLNVGIGDRQYAEENVVTSGQIITASIDAIDVELGDLNDDLTAAEADIDALESAVGPTSRYFEVTMNDLTVIADGGGDNRANLYSDYDEVDDHEYYSVKTRQTTEQDLDLKFKVLVPNDFVEFENDGDDLSFFYRNVNAADDTDTDIDITVEDEDGDVGYSTTDLYNANWTELAQSLNGADFDPAAGEYIYVTVKASASRDGANFQMPNVGELKFNYRNVDL